MILVEFEHDIRVATYGFQVAPGYAFEVADEFADLLVAHDAAGIMSDSVVREFIRYFERITRNNLQTVRSNADIVLELDEYHDCVASNYRE